MGRYILRRLAILPLQVLGVLAITFALSRMSQKSPAYWMAGQYATSDTIASIERQLGLDQPLHTQFLIYLQNVLRGDFGVSIVTGRPVLSDLGDRLPATLELITISLILVTVIGIPLGVLTGLRSNRSVGRVVTGYGFLAGSLPDFAVALILVFIFYAVLGLAPAPIGRIDPGVAPPFRITGFYVIDSLVTGNWAALRSTLSHLALPVLAMLIVYTGGVIKITRTTVRELRGSEMAVFARATGLRSSTVIKYILRNASPAIITLTGITYGFLIGAAVLVETVFGWGGLGMYSVQAIAYSDFAALQIFVTFATIFSLLVYLVVDIVLAVVDPRIHY